MKDLWRQRKKLQMKEKIIANLLYFMFISFVTLVSLLYKEIQGIGFRCVRKCVCTKGVKRVVCVGLHVPKDVDASICFSPKVISLILLI